MFTASLNATQFIGNLTADPRFPSDSIASFQVALSERAKDDAGNWGEAPPTVISVTCFDKTASRVRTDCHRGTKVAIHGRLKTDRWKDKDGNERQQLTVVAEQVWALAKFKPRDGGADGAEHAFADDAPSRF